MKLASAILKVQVQVRPGEWTAHLIDRDHGPIEADLDRGIVRFCGHVLPFEAFVDTVEASKDVLCPECREPFSNAQGLGNHRRLKHGVKGAA